jgi:hypothetical protein
VLNYLKSNGEHELLKFFDPLIGLADGRQQQIIALIVHLLFFDSDVYNPIFGKALIIVWSIIDFLIHHILSINFIAGKLDFIMLD